MMLLGLASCGVALALGCGRQEMELGRSVARASIAIAGVPGRSLSYLHAGGRSGERVIYVHGTPGDALAWRSYLARPVAGTESVAVDRLGFGASRSSSAGNVAVPSFEEQAEAIAPLLVVRGGRGTILVGHSLGGPIVCRIAAEHPDQVAGILVLAGSVDPELESWRWYNRMAGSALIRWAISRDMLVANDEVRDAAEQERAVVPLLPRIRCPVIVIHGSSDRLVPLGNAAWLREKLTSAASVDLRILAGEDHFLPWKRETDVRHAVAELAGRPAR
jgi:pimeloyl-ACP methyl ester carboxylesterase